MPEKSKTYEKFAPRVYIRTFGCQMNERDSEMIAGMLLSGGYDLVDDASKADLVLFNTCSVRQHAEDRVFGNVRQVYSSRPERGGGPRIGVLGCMAQRHGASLFDRCPGIDMAVGPNEIYDLPRLFEKVFAGERVLAVGGSKRPKTRTIVPFRQGSLTAHVNIMYGCDNFCSYCIVPYVRGRETSRAKKVIIREIKDLAERGFKQVTLLGQNVNSYGRGQTSKVSFPELLAAVNDVKGIERIRFMTSHPKDASKELFRAIGSLSKVCEHIHLPLQSASDKVLDLMNRGYSFDDYLRKVDMARKIVPGLALSTDIIVGFPSEKERDFVRTRKALERIGCSAAFIFKYSPRPPAVSAKLKDDVPEDEKKARNAELLRVQKRISRRRNRAMVGTVQEVLVESRSRLSDEELMGRTRDNTTCVFPGEPEMIGELVRVSIRDATDHTLKGEAVSRDEV